MVKTLDITGTMREKGGGMSMNHEGGREGEGEMQGLQGHIFGANIAGYEFSLVDELLYASVVSTHVSSL